MPELSDTAVIIIYSICTPLALLSAWYLGRKRGRRG